MSLAQPNLQPPKGSLRDRDNRYYAILAGGAKLKLLEAFLDLQVPELLGAQPLGAPMTSSAICMKLRLDPHRGFKFLHSLAMSGLLTEAKFERGEDKAEFSLSAESQEYFGASGTEGFFFRDLVAYYRYLNNLNVSLADVVRGADLQGMVEWPPKTSEAATHLEHWMTITAKGAISTLLASNAMHGAKNILDVGGGDGTIAMAIIRDSNLQETNSTTTVTVFNLPASAALAEANVAAAGMTERISIVVGNFLTDELPRGADDAGYDRILFSRVLTDWTPSVCKMLFEKTRRALAPGGRLVINEAFAEGNMDYCTSWEFRYIFYDTFGRVLFKPVYIYRNLLEEVGFRVLSVSPMLDDAFYSVLVAEVV